jgi:hypothetical protein
VDFIDIGFRTLVLVDEIASVIETIEGDPNPETVNGQWSPADIRTIVGTRAGLWYASELTWREMRNRLRKAGNDII